MDFELGSQHGLAEEAVSSTALVDAFDQHSQLQKICFAVVQDRCRVLPQSLICLMPRVLRVSYQRRTVGLASLGYVVDSCQKPAKVLEVPFKRLEPLI